MKAVHRIGFIHKGGVYFSSPEQIIRLQALSNYTYIYFIDHAPILMAKVLRVYDELLRPYGFIRTHRSHLVNPQYVTAIDKQGAVQLLETSVEVSRRKRSRVRKTLLNPPLMYSISEFPKSSEV